VKLKSLAEIVDANRKFEVTQQAKETEAKAAKARRDNLIRETRTQHQLLAEMDLMWEELRTNLSPLVMAARTNSVPDFEQIEWFVLANNRVNKFKQATIEAIKTNRLSVEEKVRLSGFSHLFLEAWNTAARHVERICQMIENVKDDEKSIAARQRNG
jgi:hypothetical protein